MCTVCGCGDSHAPDEEPSRDKRNDHGHMHGHAHGDGFHMHEHVHPPAQPPRPTEANAREQGSDGSADHHSGPAQPHAAAHDPAHAPRPGHDHAHDHDHVHEHTHGSARGAPDGVQQAGDDIDLGAGLAVHTAGTSQARILRIEREIMEKNKAYANSNRAYLAGLRTLSLNLVSSPGSGKTSLLVRAINDLKGRFPIAVVEGDQQTARDAERIRATGVRALQINTGKGCHLDAHMIAHALDELALEPDGLFLIENVGNLICPAGFDLGETHKVVVLSVTEGEDKPLKYPQMFAAADLMLLNKSDLLPHLEFDVGACLANALRVNPDLQTLIVSARTGEGMAAFYAWIEGRLAHILAPRAKAASVVLGQAG